MLLNLLFFYFLIILFRRATEGRSYAFVRMMETAREERRAVTCIFVIKKTFQRYESQVGGKQEEKLHTVFAGIFYFPKQPRKAGSAVVNHYDSANSNPFEGINPCCS